MYIYMYIYNVNSTNMSIVTMYIYILYDDVECIACVNLRHFLFFTLLGITSSR